MDHEIQLFHNDEFGEVRTVIIDGEPWFVGKDVAAILGYADHFGALKKHVDSEDKQNCQNDSFESPRGLTVINESGIFSLILSSKLPNAKRFKHWVTSEILPAIRKTGGYMIQDSTYFVDKYFTTASASQRLLLQSALLEIENLTRQIEEDKPKVEFADQVASSDALIDMETMAKLATDKGITIGRNRLFQWLRDIGVLIQSGNPRRNLPYQEYIDRGYFKVREKCFVHHGEYKLYYQTMVTGKGQLYIIGRLRKEYRPEMYPPEL